MKTKERNSNLERILSDFHRRNDYGVIEAISDICDTFHQFNISNKQAPEPDNLLTDDMIEKEIGEILEIAMPDDDYWQSMRDSVIPKLAKWARAQQGMNKKWVISSLENIMVAMLCDFDMGEKVNPASIEGLNAVIEYLNKEGKCSKG